MRKKLSKMMRVNWKETISVNKYEWMFINIGIYILLAYAIYSFISTKNQQKELIEGQKRASEEQKEIIEEQKRIMERQKRIEERLEKEKTE